jgi:signal recognition particle receptor subunit beta
VSAPVPRHGGRRRGRAGSAVKIVVTGPFGAGKTTLIRTISEITVLSTERSVTEVSHTNKSDTTVAMDFGRITIERDLVLYLFGTPGQERFDFMWEILGGGMLGFVLLLDDSQPASAADAAGILAAFRRMGGTPYVVAVNRSAGLDPQQEAALREQLELPAHTPVVPCDATDKESVKSVLLALLIAVLDELEPTPADV